MWRRVALYGLALAAGTALLQWLDYRHLARAQSETVYVALVAVAFLGLGVWAGVQLPGRRAPPAEPFDGNPQAQASLGISPREREVLELLAAGLANKEIAERLHVSPHTVKTHVTRLYEKLDARRRTEAILKARELGLLR
ncbi:MULTISPECIES: response regulator transcription factor [unclassified Roseateles]|uniref:helix-turn-helix transcriptional regulator n=1 Tax=unclassified Roseateles TaxID=2626991 RepID=UPI0006FA23BB|nr:MULTISPECIES: response regulator transcription factor [unclassified Roseateles]KQW51264.1 LuxR family transcriptional regulator [Pelomonas sp. Root405]KRA77496.1 LuxR family transcriptional regulator [Pelomonas sp. Root662]